MDWPDDVPFPASFARDPHATRRQLTAERLRPTFKVGDRARLRDDLGGGTVTIVDVYRGPDLFQVRPESGKPDFVVSSHALTRIAPEWRPGDVVVVQYGPNRYAPSSKYTYVRGRKGWLAEEGRPQKTDEWMTAQLDAGRATPVLQAGGEPFDRGRL